MSDDLSEIITSNTKALQSFLALQFQMASLRMGLPVINYIENFHYNPDFYLRDTDWFKSYIIREAFYCLENTVFKISVYEKLKSWIDDLGDELMSSNASHALATVRSNLSLREKKIQDLKLSYKLKNIPKLKIRDSLLISKKSIERVASYRQLKALGKPIIGLMIEAESIYADEFENSYSESYGTDCADYFTGGHHRDFLDILEAAYKDYSWGKASNGTLYDGEDSQCVSNLCVGTLKQLNIAC